jgi:23S rRNA (cytosine1962-C5)-methyltransferase
VVEDAIKYLKREITRGKKYTAILLDPPAYGRGPNGEKWILEKELFHLLSLCKQLLSEKDSFLIINLYSLNITPLLLENILISPYLGIGKPEALKYELSGFWSRKINQKDRMIYKVEEDIVTVFVISAMGHYSDK